jgi:hypothetical protein
MNTNTYQGTPQHSATIYQFPVRPRSAVSGYRGAGDAADLMAQRIADAVESCWYHDAAIKQSGGSTKT